MLMSKFSEIVPCGGFLKCFFVVGSRRRRRVFHVETAGPLAKTLDMRDFVDSFDITGRLEAGQI